MGVRKDAEEIIGKTIEDVLPYNAVRQVLTEKAFEEPVYVFAIGKAAWGMAHEAAGLLKGKICKGIVITKYGHAKGPIEGFEIMESGHPMPDENSVIAAKRLIELAKEVTAQEKTLLLLSGGGSALVELPAHDLTLTQVRSATEVLLRCGANIKEINTVRKHLSAIKGGKLARYLMPSEGYAIILSDVVGNHPEMIASGMTYPDETSANDVANVLHKYGLEFGDHVTDVLLDSESTIVNNIENIVKGNVEELCSAVAAHAEEAGYHPYIMSASEEGEAIELGKRMANIAREIREGRAPQYQLPCAVIIGGETVVKVTGNGDGGRNQEIALSAAMEMRGIRDVLLFSLASDGTDGPTDAAGGIIDGNTAGNLEKKEINGYQYLSNNNSYYALKQVNGLIMTGPTGTNVNDVTVLLCK